MSISYPNLSPNWKYLHLIRDKYCVVERLEAEAQLITVISDNPESIHDHLGDHNIVRQHWKSFWQQNIVKAVVDQFEEEKPTNHGHK